MRPGVDPLAMEAVGGAPSPPGVEAVYGPLTPTAPVLVRGYPTPSPPAREGVGWALPTPAPPSRGAHSPFPGVGVREVVVRRGLCPCSPGETFQDSRSKPFWSPPCAPIERGPQPLPGGEGGSCAWGDEMTQQGAELTAGPDRSLHDMNTAQLTRTRDTACTSA